MPERGLWKAFGIAQDIPQAGRIIPASVLSATDAEPNAAVVEVVVQQAAIAFELTTYPVAGAASAARLRIVLRSQSVFLANIKI